GPSVLVPGVDVDALVEEGKKRGSVAFFGGRQHRVDGGTGFNVGARHSKQATQSGTQSQVKKIVLFQCHLPSSNIPSCLPSTPATSSKCHISLPSLFTVSSRS